MGHNLFIKVLSYVTYIALIIHAVDGIMLTIQNKKARPVNYARNNPKANSGTASRNMAILGTLILVFLATHMANFWWKAKITEEIPLHSLVKTVDYPVGQNPATGEMITKPIEVTHYLNTNGTYQQFKVKDPSTGQEQKLFEIKNKHEFYDITSGVKIGDGYKDLHTVVMTFFDKKNSSALFGVLFYVISMLVLGYHLWHGFASAFQSLGLNHPLYTPIIKKIGMAFSIVVPFLFAIIPVIIYMNH
jgi:succinate dehydrogenase / fumarate reductase cytochrome b subunit